MKKRVIGIIIIVATLVDAIIAHNVLTTTDIFIKFVMLGIGSWLIFLSIVDKKVRKNGELIEDDKEDE